MCVLKKSILFTKDFDIMSIIYIFFSFFYKSMTHARRRGNNYFQRFLSF